MLKRTATQQNSDAPTYITKTQIVIPFRNVGFVDCDAQRVWPNWEDEHWICIFTDDDDFRAFDEAFSQWLVSEGKRTTAPSRAEEHLAAYAYGFVVYFTLSSLVEILGFDFDGKLPLWIIVAGGLLLVFVRLLAVANAAIEKRKLDKEASNGQV